MREFFMLDGEWHEFGNPDCCFHSARCSCGGILHFQPCYGGYIEDCDRCGRDAGQRRQSLAPPVPCENPNLRFCLGYVFLEDLTCTDCKHRHSANIFT